MTWEKFEYAEVDTVLPAYIMVVDEYAQFVDDVPRSQMRLADEFQGNIQKITRLGRSAHVHVVIATQSASSNLFPPSLKNNCQFRGICGRVESNISRMAIDSEEGESLPLVPGSYLGYSKGDTQTFQGYFTPAKTILSLGTVKPGFDPESGLEILDEEEFDFSKPPVDEDNLITNDTESSDESSDDDDEFFKPSNFFDDDDDDEFFKPNNLSDEDDEFFKPNNSLDDNEPSESNSNESSSASDFFDDDDDENFFGEEQTSNNNSSTFKLNLSSNSSNSDQPRQSANLKLNLNNSQSKPSSESSNNKYVGRGSITIE